MNYVKTLLLVSLSILPSLANATVRESFTPANGTFEQLCKCGKITEVAGATGITMVDFMSSYAQNRYGVAACQIMFTDADVSQGSGLAGAIGKYANLRKVEGILTYIISDKCFP